MQWGRGVFERMEGMCMEQEICLLCEDSLEGIFTGVYEAYRRHLKPRYTHLQTGGIGNYSLFTEYIEIETESSKAEKVMRTLRGRFGMEAYTAICQAASSWQEKKADAVYHTIVRGMLKKCPGQLMGDLADDAVRTVFELSRAANNEILHLKGFLRFEELEGGVLFARIGPKNDILVYLVPHFADRFPRENFMIYDESREKLVLHPAGGEWYMRSLVRRGTEAVIGRETLVFSETEQEYQELFRYFCHKIAIRERENKDLQRGMCPRRFQYYMSEFHKNVKMK